MSDDEDFEDLPRIFVNSIDHNTSSFSLPSAEELASQRKSEVECRRKLEELSRHDGAHDDVSRDSSSSEGDAALAAAALGLAVSAAPAPPPPSHALSAAELLRALAPQLPPAARALLHHPAAAERLPELVDRASMLVAADDEVWSDDELSAVGALLASAALAHDVRGRAGALRALHALLEHRATPAQAAGLAQRLVAALAAPRARLALADALRAGGGPACSAAAAVALDAALLDALEPEDAPHGAGQADAARLADAVAAGRARLDAAQHYAVLQLLGRRLAGAGGERARLLAPLTAPSLPHDTHRPDRLKVLVAADQLRLLFSVDK